MIQVGDRVVCVDIGQAREGPSSPLILGREYIVYGIDTCCSTYLDVGCKAPSRYNICSKCNDKTSDGILWCQVLLFRKVEERTIEYAVDVKIEIPEPCLS